MDLDFSQCKTKEDVEKVLIEKDKYIKQTLDNLKEFEKKLVKE